MSPADDLEGVVEIPARPTVGVVKAGLHQRVQSWTPLDATELLDVVRDECGIR
jgi:hypothetical protein